MAFQPIIDVKTQQIFAHEALVRGPSNEPSAVAERIRDLVLVTHHQESPVAQDAKILSDVDLSILGASSERFQVYERQIRQEYSWLTDAKFNQGRHQILSRFLSRDFIYSTSYFRERFETQARFNLRGALSALGVSEY